MNLSGIITLTTDFGDKDGFAGVMKGVMLGINPDVRIVDVSHSIERQSVDEAAFVVFNSYRYFPEGTIHVVVVDPGVGSSRRVILVNVMNHLFLAPDNGVLRYVLSGDDIAYAVTNKAYFLKDVSATFHGRDVFAPAAAHISRGVSCTEFGPRVYNYMRGESFNPEISEDGAAGRILYCDRFGNIVTNIAKDDLPDDYSKGAVRVRVGDVTIEGLSEYYASGEKGMPIALFGSAGFIEVAVNYGDAAQSIGVGCGDDVYVSFV